MLAWILFEMFLGEEVEAAGKEDEEEQQQRPALDGVSSSPGKTGLRSSVDTERLSPGGDADSRGERDICKCWHQSVDRGLDLLHQSLIIAVGREIVKLTLGQCRGMVALRQWGWSWERSPEADKCRS